MAARIDGLAPGWAGIRLRITRFPPYGVWWRHLSRVLRWTGRAGLVLVDPAPRTPALDRRIEPERPRERLAGGTNDLVPPGGGSPGLNEIAVRERGAGDALSASRS